MLDSYYCTTSQCDPAPGHNPAQPDVQEWFGVEEVEKWFYYFINWSVSTLGHNEIRLETLFVTRNHFLHFLFKLVSLSFSFRSVAPEHHRTGSNPLHYDRKQERVRRCQHHNLKYKLQRPLGGCGAGRLMEGWTAGHQWHKYFLYFMNSGHTHHTLTIIVATTLTLHCSGQGWWRRRDDVPPSSTTEEPNNNNHHHHHIIIIILLLPRTTSEAQQLQFRCGCARNNHPTITSPVSRMKMNYIYVAHKSTGTTHTHWVRVQGWPWSAGCRSAG